MKEESAWDSRKKSLSLDSEVPLPFMVVLFAGILAPISVPLIGALMFGNMLKVSGVCDSLSNAAQNELSNLVTLFLGITVGATMTAENILTFDVLKIGLWALLPSYSIPWAAFSLPRLPTSS